MTGLDLLDAEGVEMSTLGVRGPGALALPEALFPSRQPIIVPTLSERAACASDRVSSISVPG